MPRRKKHENQSNSKHLKNVNQNQSRRNNHSDNPPSLFFFFFFYPFLTCFAYLRPARSLITPSPNTVIAALQKETAREEIARCVDAKTTTKTTRKQREDERH